MATSNKKCDCFDVKYEGSVSWYPTEHKEGCPNATPKNSEWVEKLRTDWRGTGMHKILAHASYSGGEKTLHTDVFDWFVEHFLQDRSKDTVGEKEMRERLGNWINEKGGLYSLGAYLDWDGDYDEAILDGGFSADQLEAIAWWMKNKQKLSEQLNQK